MDISIDHEFASCGVELALGVLVYQLAGAVDPADIARSVDDELKNAMTLMGQQRPADLPAIQATRDAFRKIGKDPSRYRPSSEALLRRLASGKGLYSVGPVVDLNNAMSIHTQLPVGTYDLAKIDPPVVCRRGMPGESYAGIGRAEINLDGLTLLADNAGPFGTPFSDSERSKVDESSDRIMSVLYSFDPGHDLAGDLDWACAFIRGNLGPASIARRIIPAG